MENIVGKRYGRLVVIGPSGKSTKQGRIWQFRCDCGNTYESIVAKVRNGHSKSCGCGNFGTPVDIAGARCGRLTAVEIIGQSPAGRIWRCRCDCGGETKLTTGAFRFGKTQSCGCLQRETRSKTGLSHRTHGEGHDGKTPEYRAWSSMKERCSNPNKDNYAGYGGRGIAVCDRWRNSYEAFLSDMGRRPKRGFSLERKDTDGDYTPENCVWATAKSQQRNRRNTLYVIAGAKRLPASELAELLNVSRNTVYAWEKVNRLIEARHGFFKDTASDQ